MKSFKIIYFILLLSISYPGNAYAAARCETKSRTTELELFNSASFKIVSSSLNRNAKFVTCSFSDTARIKSFFNKGSRKKALPLESDFFFLFYTANFIKVSIPVDRDLVSGVKLYLLSKQIHLHLYHLF